jgi:pSer/pThr/pTyr-binding forkhead associated (FHA) protein
MALLILLQDSDGGVRFRIDKPRYTIGRSSDNDICLEDELVSKQHAVIEAIPQEQSELRFEYYLQDQDSTNHCFVNDEQVKMKKLRHDDVIRIGKSNFRFVDDRNDSLEETTELHKTWLPGVFITKAKKKKKSKK